jgi:hypothetical protein
MHAAIITSPIISKYVSNKPYSSLSTNKGEIFLNTYIHIQRWLKEPNG